MQQIEDQTDSERAENKAETPIKLADDPHR